LENIYKKLAQGAFFFAWWKRHFKVYYLIARNQQHGLMVQIVSGLITYFLPAIYCHGQDGERVSIRRVRQLRIQIQNELRKIENLMPNPGNSNHRHVEQLHAMP